MRPLIPRPRGTLGVDKFKIAEVLMRATAMHDGMASDPVTYSAPSPALPDFLGLIQGLGTMQSAVTSRTRGAAAVRDVARDELWSAMESERTYIQTVADAHPGRSISVLQNGGLVLIAMPVRAKGLLVLRNGAASGTVECFANVGMLLGALATKRSQHRFFNWRCTVDGGQTFTALLPTTHPQAIITGLAPMVTAGVQVNLNLASGPSEWSPLVAITVH
jgi:hypothetical protein